MRAEEICTEALLDLSKTMAEPLFRRFRYPWEVLPEIREFILSVGPELPEDEYEKRGDSVWVHRSAKVMESAHFTGPVIVCAEAEVRHCAFFRGNVLIGRGAVAGNSCEFKNSILFDAVEAPHYNYVGDSVLGFHAHMGAGSITSNIKSDRTNILIHTGEEDIETGLRKIGAILGDYAEIGCGTVLNPGAVVGRRTTVYPLVSLRGAVPADSIVKEAGTAVPKH